MAMNIEQLAVEIHEATGYEGKELTAAVLFIGMLYAEVVGQKEIGEYFARRIKEVQQ